MTGLHIVLSALADGTLRAVVVESLDQALHEVSNDITQHGTPLSDLFVVEVRRVVPLQRQPVVMVAPERNPNALANTPQIDWSLAAAAAAGEATDEAPDEAPRASPTPTDIPDPAPTGGAGDSTDAAVPHQTGDAGANPTGVELPIPPGTGV